MNVERGEKKGEQLPAAPGKKEGYESEKDHRAMNFYSPIKREKKKKEKTNARRKKKGTATRPRKAIFAAAGRFASKKNPEKKGEKGTGFPGVLTGGSRHPSGGEKGTNHRPGKKKKKKV